MSKRNYPTKIHEILELEPNEQFGIAISGFKGNLYYFNEEAHLLNADRANILDGYWVVNLINEQKNIIRNPRMNEDQIKIFNALKALGYNWLAKDEECEIYHAFIIKPAIHSNNGVWFSYTEGEADMTHLSTVLTSMFASGLSDPINISQALIERIPH